MINQFEGMKRFIGGSPAAPVLIRGLSLLVVLYDSYALAVLGLTVGAEWPNSPLEHLSMFQFVTAFALPFAALVMGYMVALLAGSVILFNSGGCYRSPLCRLAVVVNVLLVAAMAPRWHWHKDSAGVTGLVIAVPLASCLIFAAHEIALGLRRRDNRASP